MPQRIPSGSGAPRCLPWLAALLVITALPMLAPGPVHALVLDRDVSLGSQPWRLLTHSLVHFSIRHWALDFLGLTLAVLALERLARGALVPILLRGIGATAIAGPLCFLADPDLQRLGGLSCLNLALVTGLAVHLRCRPRRTLGLALSFALLVKLGTEAMGQSFLGSAPDAAIRPCPWAHGLSILAMAILSRFRRDPQGTGGNNTQDARHPEADDHNPTVPHQTLDCGA